MQAPGRACYSQPFHRKLQPSFTRRVIALVAIGFLALIAAGIATAGVQVRKQDNARWVEHTLNLESRLGSFASFNEQAETARRGVLLGGFTPRRGPKSRAIGWRSSRSCPI
jgi:hypothetical protein